MVNLLSVISQGSIRRRNALSHGTGTAYNVTLLSWAFSRSSIGQYYCLVFKWFRCLATRTRTHSRYIKLTRILLSSIDHVKVTASIITFFLLLHCEAFGWYWWRDHGWIEYFMGNTQSNLRVTPTRLWSNLTWTILQWFRIRMWKEWRIKLNSDKEEEQWMHEHVCKKNMLPYSFMEQK